MDVTGGKTGDQTVKVGRNDPCPCGSGKKWKKCCGVQVEQPVAAPEVLVHADIQALATLFGARRYLELEARALDLIRKFPEAGVVWKLLGVSLHLQGKDAFAALQKSALYLPLDPEVHNTLGAVLRKAGRATDAIASYRRALQIKPDFAEAHSNLGAVLLDLGKLEEALVCFQSALVFKPELATVQSNIVWIHSYLAQGSSAAFDEAKRYGAMVERAVRPYTHQRKGASVVHRLRVGFVSPDLRQHPVGYFLEAVVLSIKANAMAQLDLYAYSSHLVSDALSERIQPAFKQWVGANEMTDAELAAQIHRDGIDILIDLSGHTALNRLPVFAFKPAPVQVSWLGYFASTGLTTMDYLLADPWTLPKAEEKHFTEKIWRLPETRLCFTAPDFDIAVSLLPALANGFVTLGCFNNLSKVNDHVIAVWAQLMNAVPTCRILFKSKQLDHPDARVELIRRFGMHGVGEVRITLEGASPREDYLSAYHRVDMQLDPFPYPGGTVTVESLWMGVPVLTLAGQTFLSRQGVGILANAGLQDWIATDEADFVDRAKVHLGNLQRLSLLRASLRPRLLASPLCDAPRFATAFESAMHGMWAEYLAAPQRA